MQWIEARSKDARAEAHRKFCRKFGRDDVSLSNFNSLCKRKGWMTGRTGYFAKGTTPPNKGKKCPEGVGGRHPNARKTQFKKGHLPHNHNYLGHERVSKDGYVEVSIAETNPHTGFERRYVLKHRHEWEKANGPVPEGYALKCLDGDRLNTDPTNWKAVPRAVLALLNGGRHRTALAYDAAEPEVKPTVMALAELKHKLRERSNG
ncbi:HNH endonuclease signature motif containing protein [Sphingorhabdus sp. SMR4y]|uniref:HNH endonuclease signature motif containing protein n=1 Tax=Sphingorhabdus sp. SMR4y TaxID=2584094 RepID=UPI0021B2A29C|nr:HNH endonuclease signature motif containing protein [Sphingorhabdus sp. SMR4y]